MATMANNQAPRATKGGDSYGTPDELYVPLDYRYRFDFDPAADHQNARTALYATADGLFSRSRRYHVIDGDGPEVPCPGCASCIAAIPVDTTPGLDGLTCSWEDRVVFCNPPFSQIARWTAKMARERDRARLIVAVIPDDRSTEWWRDNVARKSIDVPIRPRTKFIHPPFECEPGCSGPAKPTGKRLAALQAAGTFDPNVAPGGVPWGKGHALGKPAGSPPGGIAVVEYRPDWLLP